MPDTLQGVLMARMDRLPDGYRFRILAAYNLKNWDLLWQDVKALRNIGLNFDQPTLDQWRKESNRPNEP